MSTTAMAQEPTSSATRGADAQAPPCAPVSVIIPVYNTEMALARCLDSVLDQVPPPAQVIVVDDGSSDHSPEIARGYGDRIIFIQQANAGQGAARNNGLTRATAEYIAYLDADDYWLPGFLGEMVEFLDSHPEAVAASCGWRIVRHDGSKHEWPPSELVSHAMMLSDFFGFWADNDHIRTGTVLLRRSAAVKHEGQNARLRVSQDLEFWALLGVQGPWGVVPSRLWVGDARVGKQQGWKKKYAKRRKLCPTVEEWSERLLPLVPPGQQASFSRIRGRVAANYAHSKILGGDRPGARQIVQTYGREMPRTWLTKLMRRGSSLGPAGWWAVCQLLALRETWKDLRG